MDKSEKPEPERLAVSVPEAAAMLGVGRTKAYEAIRTGELPSVRLGKRVLVPLAQLRAMLSGDVAGGM